MNHWLVAAIVAGTSFGASGAGTAQRPNNPRAAARKEARQEEKAAEKAEAKAENGTDRQKMLAVQVREACARVVRQRLNLNDDQARRLKEVDDRYELQRNDVAKQEREARQS